MGMILSGIIVSYLLGSIPTAYLCGRLLKGIDIRQHGSGNVGATNVMRVLGKGPGIAVLLLDALKGFLAVAVIAPIVSSQQEVVSAELAAVLCGVSSIAGHNWMIFLRFKGGKGMATTLGVLAGLSASNAQVGLALIVAIAVWLGVFLMSRIVSIASMVSALAFSLCMLWFGQSSLLVCLSWLLCLLIILRHKSNLSRLLQGKEPRLSFRKKPSS